MEVSCYRTELQNSAYLNRSSRPIIDNNFCRFCIDLKTKVLNSEIGFATAFHPKKRKQDVKTELNDILRYKKISKRTSTLHLLGSESRMIIMTQSLASRIKGNGRFANYCLTPTDKDNNFVKVQLKSMAQKSSIRGYGLQMVALPSLVTLATAIGGEIPFVSDPQNNSFVQKWKMNPFTMCNFIIIDIYYYLVFTWLSWMELSQSERLCSAYKALLNITRVLHINRVYFKKYSPKNATNKRQFLEIGTAHNSDVPLIARGSGVLLRAIKDVLPIAISDKCCP